MIMVDPLIRALQASTPTIFMMMAVYVAPQAILKFTYTDSNSDTRHGCWSRRLVRI